MRWGSSSSLPQTVSPKRRSRVPLPAIVLLLLTVMTALPAVADVESARTLWSALQQQQAEVLAPKRYRDTEKAMRELEKAVVVADAEKQQAKLAKAEEKLETLNEAVLTVQALWPELLAMRARAQEADAAAAAADSWLKAETLLISAAEKLESNRREAALRQAEPLPGMYKQAHKEAVHFNLVGNTRRLIAEADKLEASQYTPRSYVRALDAVEHVEQLLQTEPDDSPALQDAARLAALKTRHMRWLLERIRGVLRAETRPQLESEIVAWEDALAQSMITIGLTPEFEGGLGVPLQQVQVEADRLVRERDRLRQQLSATLANLDSLRSEIQNLKGNVEEFQGMVALLRPYEEDARLIETIQARFTQGEGRVLVENRDVILRLHGLRFASSEASIAAANHSLCRPSRIFPPRI